MWQDRLEQWQRDLIARLERGLGRPLNAADLACVVWESGGQVMSVVGRPLLGELRTNNLTSNVFRTWNADTARRGALHRSNGS
jgi:hypothetical protein